MIGALWILAAMVVFGVILWIADVVKYGRRKEIELETSVPPPKRECCGLHLICEKDAERKLISNTPEYFDDEELDRFKGRGADEYSDEEIEEFRDILLTMKIVEIADWNASLEMRGIVPPVEIKDEMLLIIEDERNRE